MYICLRHQTGCSTLRENKRQLQKNKKLVKIAVDGLSQAFSLFLSLSDPYTFTEIITSKSICQLHDLPNTTTTLTCPFFPL